MIRYLKHHEIDLKQWDALLCDCGNVYALSWYLEIVHPQFEALVEVEDDKYLSLMPLTGGSKFGVHYLSQPFFVQQLGLFSRKKLTSEGLSEFLRAIPEQYRFAEIRLNESNAFDNNIEGVEYHRNIVLRLNREHDVLRSQYHTNTRRNLVKAENNNLQLSDDVDIDDVIVLFRAHRGAGLRAWGDKEYALLHRLATEAVRRGAAFVCGVRPMGSDTLLCGALFMHFRGVLTFLFSGCGLEGKQRQAMTFLLDGMVHRFAGQDVVFDFEGSDDDNLARFYLGFGGTEVQYPSYTFNRLPMFGKWLLKGWKKLRD